MDINLTDNTSALEKKTFILHIISQFFNGISLAVVILQDIILKKSLGGSDFQVMILVFLASSAFLVSIYGSEIVNRSASRFRTIIMIGFSAKSFLIMLPFIDSPVFYIFCIAGGAYMDSMLLSIWNIAFKHNYTEQNRSRLFSYASTVQTILLLVTSTIIGYFLDINNELYKNLFPFAGICGMVMYYNLAKMISLSMDDYKGKNKIKKSTVSLKLIKDIIILPVRSLLRIFADNKPFLRFEIFFFLYGMAFMVLTPVVPVFLVDDLRLSYSPISIAKGFVFHSALIIFIPLMGRFHGRGNPTKFCGFVFLTLALYPLILVSAKHSILLDFPINKQYVVFISHFIFGVAMSGVSIAWALSSIYYAPVNEVSNYQAAHITLTGVRGIFSPALGYIVMKIFAIQYTFYLSAFLFILSGIFMFLESKKLHKN
ncbi:MAG: MFS transporter [Chlorobi bacterium]|nr:MFS transporter [Chlorobiota bacterium]